eukprot:s591_g27.t1
MTGTDGLGTAGKQAWAGGISLMTAANMSAENQNRDSPPSVDYNNSSDEELLSAEGPALASGSNAVTMEVEEKFHEGDSDAAGHIPETRDQERPLIPRRVENALQNSRTFTEYRRNRPFKFMHLYSGANDVLGKAIEMEAARNRLTTVVLSLDCKLDPSLDLADPGGFSVMRDDVAQGEWDFVHAGFPSLERNAQHRHKVPDRPGTGGEDESDRLVRMATQAVQIYEMEVKSCVARRVTPLATFENPPGNDSSSGVWGLPEVARCLQNTSGRKIPYDACAFQVKDKDRWARQGMWAGRLENIHKIQRVCKCPAWIKHWPVDDETTHPRAREYPADLVELVAVEVVTMWKRTLSLEWWRHQMEVNPQGVNELQKSWLENEEMKEQGSLKRAPPAKRAASVASKIDSIEDDVAGTKTEEKAAKFLKVDQVRLAVGGMRNPAKCVRSLTQLEEVGKKLASLWAEFAESHPGTLNVAVNYGQPNNAIEPELFLLWRKALRENLGKIKEIPVTVKENWQFNTSLEAGLWEVWGERASDPDGCLPDFMRRGVPLGMQVQLPPSGVFPAVADETKLHADQVLELALMKSFFKCEAITGQQHEASIEIERHVDKGRVKRVTWQWVKEVVGTPGTVAKLGLGLHQQEDGSTGRKICLDMSRSMGDSRVKLDERIVLPRLTDVIGMLQDMWKGRGGDRGRRGDDGDNEVEFYTLEVEDIFCHFPIRLEELGHCITADENNEGALVWTAMMAGYKAGPQLAGRLASALGRLLQSLVNPQDAQFQVYFDEILLATVGDKASREEKLAAAIYTAAAFGMNLNLAKGRRGRRISWLECVIEVPAVNLGEPELVTLAMSSRVVVQLIKMLESWKGQSMGLIEDLRMVTGWLCWASGGIPRLRWAANFLYNLYKVLKGEEGEGVEEPQIIPAANRDGSRPKAGLFQIKLLKGVRLWVLKLLENPVETLVRVERLVKPRVSLGFITEASVEGWGAILVKIYEGIPKKLVPLEAVECLITGEEAKLLKVTYNDVGTKAVLEAYAVLRALDLWGHRFQERAVMMRFDSSLGRAVTWKVQGMHPTVSFLAAEVVLRLEKHQVQRLGLHHLRGSWASEATWLGQLRERENEARPDGLIGVHLKRETPWNSGHFWLKAPGDDRGSGAEFAPDEAILECLTGTVLPGRGSVLASMLLAAQPNRGTEGRADIMFQRFLPQRASRDTDQHSEPTGEREVKSQQPAQQAKLLLCEVRQQEFRAKQAIEQARWKGKTHWKSSWHWDKTKRLRKEPSRVKGHAKRGRCTEPKPPVQKKSLKEVAGMTKSATWIIAARAKLKEKMFAASTLASKESKRRKVVEVMESCGINPGGNGISCDDLLTVAAVLGECNIRSADQYLAEVKLMQLENGVSWTDVLERQLVMVKRALKRDVGPEGRAKEFNPEGIPTSVWETRCLEVFAYYGLSYSADSLCSNAYVSLMLVSGSDVVACLFASRASQIGRNRAQFGSYLLGGLCLMACAFGTTDSAFVMTMTIIARMCLSVAFVTIYVALAEVFPEWCQKIVILSSSWRRPHHRNRRRLLENRIAHYLGKPFHFHSATPMYREDSKLIFWAWHGCERTAADRLETVGEYVADFCTDSKEKLGSVRVLMLEDFFITPMDGWKCRGHSVASVSAAEQVLLSYAKSALPATSDVRVKVCHCYSEVTCGKLKMQVGTGLTQRLFEEAKSFVSAAGTSPCSTGGKDPGKEPAGFVSTVISAFVPPIGSMVHAF